MKLTTIQANKVIEKLKQHQLRCKTCGKTDLQINDTILELREFNGGDMIIGNTTSIFPVIAVTCNNCGETQFFNAVLMGILDKGE